MARLDHAGEALRYLALQFQDASAQEGQWFGERWKRVLGFTTPAHRLVARRDCEMRLAPFLDKLGHIWGAKGLLIPTIAPDDGLTECLSLTAIPGPAVDADNVAYRTANLLVWAGLCLRIEFDEKVDLPICLQMLGHRPELSVRYADEPDLAARLPVFSDPCSWIGLAGVVAFVMLHGDKYGVLVIDPQSTINKLRVYTRSDIQKDAKIIVLAAPFDMTGWAAVSLSPAVRQHNEKGEHTTAIPWHAVRPHTASKEVTVQSTPRAANLFFGRRDRAQQVVDVQYPTVQHLCVDIETGFLNEIIEESAVMYACATRATHESLPTANINPEVLLMSQSIPREQVNILPRATDWSCDGETNWNTHKKLASWRYPGSDDFPDYVQSQRQKRWKKDFWVAREHTHAKELPTRTAI